MKLEQIYETLKDFAEKEEELISKYPCDSEYDVPTWDKIYDALEIIDSIIITNLAMLNQKHTLMIIKIHPM